MMRLTASIGLAIYAALAVCVGGWVGEGVPVLVPPAQIVRTQEGAQVLIQVPALVAGRSLAVTTTVATASGVFVYETPRLNMSKGVALKTVLLPALPPGYYTVTAAVGYSLNPIRYVNQSALVALLIIEERKQ